MLPGVLEQETDTKKLYAKRREDLVNYIKQEHEGRDGLVVLFADFENDRERFLQESSFYYYTGINEPGVALTIDLEGNTTLYIPHCFTERKKWMDDVVEPTEEWAQHFGVNKIDVLGDECKGYQLHPFFTHQEYNQLLEVFNNVIRKEKAIFTLCPDNTYEYVQQRCTLYHIDSLVNGFKQECVDISPLVADMRSTKDMHEISLVHQAIEVTMMAHEAAAQAVVPENFESDVQASIEYIYTSAGARKAFPSIVGSGKKSTTLHYTTNNGQMNSGDLVVVDIGAQSDHYCADLSRTFPVSGTFTARQKEVYDIVLATQEHIAELVQPGYWLNNKEHPEKSLHHLAKKFLDERGYGHYFTHGIGHYLGLDVHDVGDYKRPLREGDVFTIEPGVYIPDEKLGVRIEDDYWLVKGGAVCLSESLPKTTEDIEAFMRAEYEPNPDIKMDMSSLDNDTVAHS